MIFSVLLLGCLEKAPKEASLFRRTLTLRIRNHAYQNATAMKEAAWSIEAKHPFLYEGLLWVASVVEPRDYLTSAHCRDGHNLLICQK